jgi:hypothetical protein
MINGFDLLNWNNKDKSDEYNSEGLISNYIPTTEEEDEINIFFSRMLSITIYSSQ